MKNIRALIPVISLLTLLTLASCAKQDAEKGTGAPPPPDRPLENPIDRFSVYRFPRFAARVQYPAEWELREDKIGAAFLLPGTGGETEVMEGVTILVETMYGDEMSFEQYGKRIIADLKKRTADFTLIESAETTLGGEPAYRFTYSGLFDDTAMHFTSVYCIARGLLAVASYSAASSRFDEFASTAQTVFGSFEFL